jgi:hypothetical protein
LKLYSDNDGNFTRDYVSAEGADIPAYNVFTRKDGAIRHFWSGEMGSETADPGQDPRGAPDLDPLWSLCKRLMTFQKCWPDVSPDAHPRAATFGFLADLPRNSLFSASASHGMLGKRLGHSHSIVAGGLPEMS